MAQAILPLIPEGTTPITDIISVRKEDGKWYYFFGVNPVFSHTESDRRSFQMFTSQLVYQGQCKQVDIQRVFGTSPMSVKRGAKKYREGGVEAFYTRRRGRGPSVLTEEVMKRAQGLLDEGKTRTEVATELGMKRDTLRKAINQGRLHEPDRERGSGEGIGTSDKSQRSVEDAAAEIGTACTRVAERTLAAFGVLEGAATRFEACRDVSFGGVLCALPALASNGLFRHLTSCFSELKGYYRILHIMMLLGYMSLCRIKTVEKLRYEPPGELGKLLGLDRAPEVRCVREKLSALSGGDGAKRWGGLLSREWLEGIPELAGTLYVDGHVRVYHGRLTKLPRRYVSREKLCLRGTTDYWVNDALGQPFFVISRTVNEGLLKTLRTEIVPRLKQEVPNQPSEGELEADPHLHRFILVFDREGYSPAFFREMWEEHRIACITYHKYPEEGWPEAWFSETEVTMPNGERVSMMLAEQGSRAGHKKKGLWVREIRKLTESGHQTSVISTAYKNFSVQDCAFMFSRWSQENFFRYMMEDFGIDKLCEYGTEEIPGLQPVVNPRWRELDSRCRSLKGKLVYRTSKFGALTLHPELEPKRYETWAKRKAKLVEEIQQYERELEEATAKRKSIPKHISVDELPEGEKFERLAPGRKHLVDTIKMIAYRAETAMAMILREDLGRPDDARPLLKDLYQSEADILPDNENGILYVRVHHMANSRANRAITWLLSHLNKSELTYPGTNMKLHYSMVGAL